MNERTNEGMNKWMEYLVRTKRREVLQKTIMYKTPISNEMALQKIF